MAAPADETKKSKGRQVKKEKYLAATDLRESRVRHDLAKSMREEATAVSDYQDRGRYAANTGDHTTARLYEHIAKEEEKHKKQFKERGEKLAEKQKPGNPYSPQSQSANIPQTFEMPRYFTVSFTGDTVFHEGDVVSEEALRDENDRVIGIGKRPAKGWRTSRGVLKGSSNGAHERDELDEYEPCTIEDKLVPALRPFEPYHYAEYILRFNNFSADEIPLYSGETGKNPLRVPDRVWKEVIKGTGGKFIKQGQLYIFHIPDKATPDYMRAAPSWKDVASTRKLTKDDIEVYLSLPPYKAEIWVEDKETGKTIWSLEGAENINRFGSKAMNRDQLEEMVKDHLADIGIIAGEENAPGGHNGNYVPSPRDEKEFISDSTELVPYTIDDIGYRDKIDDAFKAAIARAKGG